MSKLNAVTMSREEVTWLFRKVRGMSDHAQRIINERNGRTDLSPQQEKELEAAKSYGQGFLDLTSSLGTLMDNGKKNILALQARRAELEEAIQLADEEDAKAHAKLLLSELPQEESYTVQMDRASLKEIIVIVQKDLENIRTTILPEYQARPDSAFTDKIQTRSWYVNKTIKAKEMLEKLLIKLEKRL